MTVLTFYLCFDFVSTRSLCFFSPGSFVLIALCLPLLFSFLGPVCERRVRLSILVSAYFCYYCVSVF